MNQSRTFHILLCLVAAGMAAQVIPFALYHAPDAAAIAATTVPADYPQGYEAADFARAHAFNRAFLLGGVARSVTWVVTVLALIASGIAWRLGTSSVDTKRAWLARVLFLIAIYVCFRLVEMPFLACKFHHFRDFGLTPLSIGGWVEILLLGLPIPLALFVLKYLLVVCSFPLFKRLWWVAACLCIFVLTDILPEVVSRRYPLDPVETLAPLQQGEHSEAMQAVLDKAGESLPIMVVDHGKRANTANVYISGRHGRQYVVVTDTFLAQFTPKDAALALGHELGHLKHETEMRIVGKAFTILTLASGFLLAFLLTGRAIIPISEALHTVLILMLCVAFASFVLQPLSNAFYRRQEAVADREAVRFIPDKRAYGELLVKMAKLNLEPLDMPKWEEYLFSSYPSVLSRIRYQGSGE